MCEKTVFYSNIDFYNQPHIQISSCVISSVCFFVQVEAFWQVCTTLNKSKSLNKHFASLVLSFTISDVVIYTEGFSETES